MWTGLGVIFIICALVWPVIKFLSQLLFYTGASAVGQKDTQKMINKAYEEEKQQALLDTNRRMTSDYRYRKLKEYPTSVVVGEKYEFKKEWSDSKGGWVFPYTVKYPTYYWKRKKEVFVSYDSNHTRENGFTKYLYEYIQNVEFIDDCDPEQWCNENNIYLGKFGVATERKEYIEERERQCDRYCEAISMLAHRYICFGNNIVFRNAFIKVLMENRDIALAFIKECHVANEWRKDYNQIYDCDNYLQDFMKENCIQDQMDKTVNHRVYIPSDLRYYRPDTPDASAAKHIKHEQEKRGWHSNAAKSELKSQQGFGMSAIGLVMLIVGVILFFVNIGSMEQIVVQLGIFAILIAIFFWAMLLYKSCVHQEHSKNIQQAEIDEDKYKNPLLEHTNNLGRAYAKEVYNEIMTHPAPYKYYSYQK